MTEATNRTYPLQPMPLVRLGQGKYTHDYTPDPLPARAELDEALDRWRERTRAAGGMRLERIAIHETKAGDGE